MVILQRLFLESPAWLGVFSFLFFAIALFLRRRLSPEYSGKVLPICLLVIGLLFMMQHLVITEREVLVENIETMTAAVEHKDVDGVLYFISNSYDAGGMNHEAFADYVRSFVKSITVRDARIISCDIRLEGNQAIMNLRVRATVSIRGEVGEFHWGAWVIDWEKEHMGWRIIRITPKMIDGIPIDSMPHIRGMN